MTVTYGENTVKVTVIVGDPGGGERPPTLPRTSSAMLLL